MSSSAFVIKQGDRRPYLRYQLKIGDVPLNLTGASVVFVMRQHGEDTVLVSLLANQIDILAGIVEPAWLPGSTDTRGIYDCSFVVTLPGGEKMTVPAQGFIYVLIE